MRTSRIIPQSADFRSDGALDFFEVILLLQQLELPPVDPQAELAAAYCSWR